ncbi:orotidine-5'-phosphate decarboxylase [Jatrophihabitans sp.]|uniref:orotidine-5'-phosphate decarboxylase n=1 Tax=Jatrophihabitans sp. TaxID=1932789 RepID=UPI002BBF4E25|nr:orotidine-5'-phosphate decarboxylase [Jatrophihabitans sp.]
MTGSGFVPEPHLAAEPAGFGQRLCTALERRGALCLGIDPHSQLLHEWGLADDLASLERFALGCVEAFADLVPVIKPQSAFFERFGSRGIAVLERTVAAARAAGALVLADVKRGDIGSTMAAYGEAYLDPSSELAVDAITVSPYLGVGSLEPAFELAERYGAGVFVLALTSNKEGPQVQHARLADGRTVAQSVIDELAARNAGAEPLGSYGVVVGATIGESVAQLGGLNGPYLVPGIGAQGGTAADVRRIFGGHLGAVLPSVSREVLRAGPSLPALRAAAERAIEDFLFLRG